MAKFVTLGLVLLMLFTGRSAEAQLTFTLTPTTAVVLPGSMLTFQATLTNIGLTEVFLNADRFQFNGTGVSLDDAKFFANTPLSLVSNEVWTGDIFDVMVDLGALPGDYSGTFTIIGGVDPFSQDDLAEQIFTVTVPAAVTAPEPSSLSLLEFTIVPCALFITLRRKRKATVR